MKWGLSTSHTLVFPSGASTASQCVLSPSGRWQGTTMSEHFYMLRESIMSAACLSQGSIPLIHSHISDMVITVLCP